MYPPHPQPCCPHVSVIVSSAMTRRDTWLLVTQPRETIIRENELISNDSSTRLVSTHKCKRKVARTGIFIHIVTPLFATPLTSHSLKPRDIYLVNIVANHCTISYLPQSYVVIIFHSIIPLETKHGSYQLKISKSLLARFLIGYPDALGRHHWQWKKSWNDLESFRRLLDKTKWNEEKRRKNNKSEQSRSRLAMVFGVENARQTPNYQAYYYRSAVQLSLSYVHFAPCTLLSLLLTYPFFSGREEFYGTG